MEELENLKCFQYTSGQTEHNILTEIIITTIIIHYLFFFFIDTPALNASLETVKANSR